MEQLQITKATHADIPALEALVNSAYRGEASKQGWTTEADLLEGEQRTDAAELAILMGSPQAVILTCKTDGGQLMGCVYLREEPEGLYLGMLSVSPKSQGGGIGKKLVAAAEAHARQQGCAAVFMTVISVRHELIAWYRRLGYALTGQTKPFPLGDGRFGVPTQALEFLVLRKGLG
jgi:ribosomal protein S18 acetylase RimI-like enzyme